MLTVRYPNGTTVDYNGAVNVKAAAAGGFFLINKNGGWLVWVPPEADVIVEWADPCAVHDGTVEAIKRIADDPDRLRDLPGYTLKKLKRALRGFDMRTWRWKR